MSTVRLVVDDHPMVRDGLRSLFSTVPDVDVVGVAADSALQEVTLHRPDVVLLDVHLPGRTGIDALAGLRRASPEARVLLLTMDDDADTVLAAVRTGADGYLVKGASQAEMLRAVRAVRDGQMILGSGVDRHLRALAAPPAVTPFPRWPARTGDPRPGGHRPDQRGHRRPAVPVAEDGRQLPDDRVRQAVRSRSHARGHRGP